MITTNRTLDELAKLFDPSFVDRLTSGKIVRFVDPSLRHLPQESNPIPQGEDLKRLVERSDRNMTAHY